MLSWVEHEQSLITSGLGLLPVWLLLTMVRQGWQRKVTNVNSTHTLHQLGLFHVGLLLTRSSSNHCETRNQTEPDSAVYQTLTLHTFFKSLDYITCWVIADKIKFKTMVRPGAKLELTALGIKREVTNVNSTHTLQDRREIVRKSSGTRNVHPIVFQTRQHVPIWGAENRTEQATSSRRPWATKGFAPPRGNFEDYVFLKT